MPWISGGALPWTPALTWQCNPQIEALVRATPAGACVIDLGSGGRQVSASTVCVDFIVFANTSVVADVQSLPFRSESVDLVIATGLLEHVDDPVAVIKEVVRVLRPGGVVHVEVPFIQQYHEDPIDYRRYTGPGLQRELERHGLQAQRTGYHIGPTVAIITLLTYYLAMWFNGPRMAQKVLSTAIFAIASAVLWPLRYLDALAKRCWDAHRLSFGVYCTASKPYTVARQDTV